MGKKQSEKQRLNADVKSLALREKLGPPELRPLNVLEERFCRAYLSDPAHSGTNAYQEACDHPVSWSQAQVAAARLLRQPNIIAHLRAEVEDILIDYHLDAAELTRIKAEIVRFDPASLFGADGNVLPIHAMPASARLALESYRVRETVSADGEARREVVVSWAKKAPILDQLSKQLGLYAADNLQKTSTLAQLLDRIDGRTVGLPPPVDHDIIDIS